LGIGVTLQQLQGWRGQYDCVVRWRARVVSAANGAPSADELDFLLTFFENAYRLRDWLVQTDAVLGHEVDAFIASRVELRICRDLANGFKHHSISKPSIDSEFAIVNQYVDPEPNGRAYRFPNGEWTILAGGRQFGLVELSDRVISIWREYLRGKALLDA
jgi:hypothetical protein